MKIRTQLLLLLTVLAMSCQNRDVNSSATFSKDEIHKTFEDQVLKGKLVISEIKGTSLFGKIELTNKTENKITFDFKDFAFKCDQQFGRLPIEKEKYFYLVNSEIKLEPVSETVNHIELVFDEAVDVEKLKIYFKGSYKRLLNI